jgi:hypothetical protein
MVPASFITLLAVPFATLPIFFDCRLGLVEVGGPHGEQVMAAIIYVLLPLLLDGDCVLPAVVCCMVSRGAGARAKVVCLQKHGPVAKRAPSGPRSRRIFKRPLKDLYQQ